jgi:hypothetical protein
MRTALLALMTVTSLVMAPVSAAPSAAVRSAPSLAALTQVSSDPFTNTSSYHATEVEPDTYAVGSTIVGAFQAGRSPNGGRRALAGSPASTRDGTGAAASCPTRSTAEGPMRG